VAVETREVERVLWIGNSSPLWIFSRRSLLRPGWHIMYGRFSADVVLLDSTVFIPVI